MLGKLGRIRGLTINTVLLGQRILYFGGLIFLGYLVYRSLIDDLIDDWNPILPFLLLWLLTAYITLPRIHRILTKIYLPDYYIGRTRTADGLLSDPINLALFRDRETVIKAFELSGWHLAQPKTIQTMARILYAGIFKRSYPEAPVSDSYLFARKQDLAFERETEGNPRSRHHFRLWKTPEGWRMPGGHKADWVGAATYDRSIGITLFTAQLNHKIAENIDEERDYIIKSLEDNGQVKDIEIIKHFTDAYHTINSGGDKIRTDGSMPFVYLNQ